MANMNDVRKRYTLDPVVFGATAALIIAFLIWGLIKPHHLASVASPGLDWITSALLLVAVGAASGALNSILTDVQWWLVVMLVAILVRAAIGIGLNVPVTTVGDMGADSRFAAPTA